MKCEECMGTGVAERIEGYEQPCPVCDGHGVLAGPEEHEYCPDCGRFWVLGHSPGCSRYVGEGPQRK